MPILNIAAYQFTPLDNLLDLKASLLTQCQQYQLKGTILLSKEGININLAGAISPMEAFISYLGQSSIFLPFRFLKTYSKEVPFKRLKVKIKKEIICFREANTVPTKTRATKTVSPQQLKNWLDHKQSILLLDTRNEVEVQMGSFKGAKHLHLNHFSELRQKINLIDRHQPVVIFCTGGIRCEKAGLFMEAQGFNEVYQLEGGILRYFAEVGSEHYEGKCFVFDERISLSPDLLPSN